MFTTVVSGKMILAKRTERINDEQLSHLLANRPDLVAAQLAHMGAYAGLCPRSS